MGLYGRRSRGAERARQMYATGRSNPTARKLAKAWAWVFAHGLAPQRWVTLQVPGRTSGRPTRFPLGMARYGDEWYLVSMLGECNWVRNVRANGGRATLEGRRTREVRLHEVLVSDRAPIIKEYLRKVPGGRPHIPVAVEAPLADFEAIAATIPVFLVVEQGGGRRPGSGGS